MHIVSVGKRRGLVAPVIAAALALVVAAIPAIAADTRWQDRGDRFEGIRAENVAGGDFKLLGVHVEPGPRSREAPRIYLSVPLREPAELRIQVWEPESGYSMIPKKKKFRPGDRFIWVRDAVLGPKGIDADQLYALATNPLETLYYPARLTTTESVSGEPGTYVFSFHSGGGVGLDVTIAREENGRFLEVRKWRRDERYGGLLGFDWDGRDAAGARAPAGIYHLKLEGAIYLTRDRPIDVDVPFIHHGQTVH